MKKFLIVALNLALVFSSFAQGISEKLRKAYQQFEADSQLRHATSSLYVINAKTGEVVFDKNSQIGLAPASTQKIITAATAFELLGRDFRYKTEFGVGTDSEKDQCLWIIPSGDPTFGSWRWETTNEGYVLKKILDRLQLAELHDSKSINVNATGWNTEKIPDGWIWQDIGNYYGAGADILNWRENQYDLILESGDKIGDRVNVIGTVPTLHSYPIYSEATSAAKGTGDNSYIYLPVKASAALVRGTIPIGEHRFKISGSIVEPMYEFVASLEDSLKARYGWTRKKENSLQYGGWFHSPRIYYTYYSPPLDSIIYWFLQKSINLYGEALIKTIAAEKKKIVRYDTSTIAGSTDSGVVIVKDFWKQKGIDEDELNIMDGSGLSPQNRVTTHAQVEILKYAKTKDWFPYFYDALPTYNRMKMKSGSIRDVKGFCGYQKSPDGNEYIFSFLVNNYNGSSSAVVNKMFKVLDVLK